MKSKEFYMNEALREAVRAERLGEVPIGAVVVSPDGRIIGRGGNRVELFGTQSQHAEMRAISRAARVQGTWRLDGCALYVTVEPCMMCVGALALSRIDRVFYGARSPLFGSTHLLSYVLHGYKKGVVIEGGLQGEACSDTLGRFFRKARME